MANNNIKYDKLGNRYVKYTDRRTGKTGWIKQKNTQVSAYKTEAQRRAEDRSAIVRFLRKLFLETPSGKKESYDHSAKAVNNNTRTSQDKFQTRNYNSTKRKSAPARQQQMKDYTLDEVVVTANRPASAKKSRTTAPARRKSVPTKTTPRYSSPKNTVHPDADDTPVTMLNPNYTPVTDNIQFRPLNYFRMEDPYGRTASQAFDAELAEKAARRQAVLDMYGIAPSGSSVSDLTDQYNYGKNMWW